MKKEYISYIGISGQKGPKLAKLLILKHIFIEKKTKEGGCKRGKRAKKEILENGHTLQNQSKYDK